LFWQVNDCWPVASWSSIDYFGRWKALQYGAKRFFRDVLLSACEDGNHVAFHLTNDTLSAVEGVLKYELCDIHQGILFCKEKNCVVSRLNAEMVAGEDFSDYLRTDEERRTRYVHFSFSPSNADREKFCQDGTVLFVNAKHFEFQEPKIQVHQIDARSYGITANTFCKFVSVEFEEDVILSDNFFDLVPDDKKVIHTDKELKELPNIYTLYDSIG
jgi:beta-mannosidase